ncbi:hypothetical protein EYZ11_009648 [Aspergillus tanneri]|uniref:Uncharacterized protein n=1 Tax=Aspergillus tanneri TaxID=1220188 RepID=A0A4S3J7D5_9EURO|nr:hypothetical protein EYZ11_009648 [Aspergillus tanneri]
MDPFSITVGALGITDFAISSIGHLRDFINSLDEAKDVIQDITSSLEAIQRPLSVLTELTITDSTTYVAAKEDLKKAGLAESVNKCGQACAEFTKKLEQWTKHSSATKTSLRDRLSIGFWNKEKIRTLRTQVQSCQAIVQFAVDSAQLTILVRSEDASKIDRQETKKHLRVLETAIQEHIETTKRKQGEILQRKEDLKIPEDGCDDEDGGAQRTLAIQEIDKQSRLLEEDQTASGVVSQILSKLSVQEVGNTNSTFNTVFSGSHNKGIQIGHSTGTINWNSSST